MEKLVKSKERSSSRSRQSKRVSKVKAAMTQIVKQVRRSKRGKSAAKINEKSSGVRSGKSKIGGSGSNSSTKMASKSRSSSSTSGRAKKKKTSRSLQQLHVLEKSVFRSRIQGLGGVEGKEGANVPSEPVPYIWVQTELSKTAKTKEGGGLAGGTTGGPLERTSSQSSLVGKSIIYLDDEVLPFSADAGKITTATTAADTTSTNDEQKNLVTFSMEELAMEITRIKCNDIFDILQN